MIERGGVNSKSHISHDWSTSLWNISHDWSTSLWNISHDWSTSLWNTYENKVGKFTAKEKN